MRTRLYSHPLCTEHDPGEFHPECPERLRTVLKGLRAKDFDCLDRVEAPEADLIKIEHVHSSSYISELLSKVPSEGRVKLDPDTALSPFSGHATLRAVGAVIAATEAVLEKNIDNAFCAVRPPGHHAEASQAMGFCLFNAAAIGAFNARATYGLDRVAVIDFDVHHGNGTQHSFEHDAGLFYASSHQYPAYPGTGSKTETGDFGNICNVPLSPGSSASEFKNGYDEVILPKLKNFRPELIILSAGFDAHEKDPLADLRLHADDFLWVTRRILDVADSVCDGRVISVLEGGYHHEALQESAVAHVSGLIGQ